jgi:hypothetical protein
VNDWVGRCIAETKTATATRAVTLTYGRDDKGNEDHGRAALLTYSDVQLYFKALRNSGYRGRHRFKFFAVGEYGSLKGRAHWHVLLFFSGKVPPHEVSEARVPVRFEEPHWPHGYSTWGVTDAAAIRYTCKYILKDTGPEGQAYKSMSKTPPIGSEYFARLARRYAENGLAPQSPTYWFNEVKNKRGEVVHFFLQGVSLDLYCQAFLDAWAELHGGHPPVSEMIEDYCDRVSRFARLPDIRPFVPASKPFFPPPGEAEPRFSEPHNTWTALDPDGRRWFWGFDHEGNRVWQRSVMTEASAQRERMKLLERASQRASMPPETSSADAYALMKALRSGAA